MTEVEGRMETKDAERKAEPVQCKRHPGTALERTAEDSKYRGAFICPECHYESEFGAF